MYRRYTPGGSSPENNINNRPGTENSGPQRQNRQSNPGIQASGGFRSQQISNPNNNSAPNSAQSRQTHNMQYNTNTKAQNTKDRNTQSEISSPHPQNTQTHNTQYNTGDGQSRNTKTNTVNFSGRQGGRRNIQGYRSPQLQTENKNYFSAGQRQSQNSPAQKPITGIKKKKGIMSIFERFLPGALYNQENKKILGILSAEDLLLIALIFLFADSSDDDSSLICLALLYVLLSDYIDLSDYF